MMGVEMRRAAFMISLIRGTPSVTFMDANHCPGAVVFLFALPNHGPIHVHTGDFRASPELARELLARVPTPTKSVDQLFLDTTYCDDKYDFPPQASVVAFAVNIATDRYRRDPRTRFVVGTYTIGKERVFVALAKVRCSMRVLSLFILLLMAKFYFAQSFIQALGGKVYVSQDKLKVRLGNPGFYFISFFLSLARSQSVSLDHGLP
jgi:hypothetical protein